MFRWKYFENRSVLGEDMDKSMWLSFFPTVYILLFYSTFACEAMQNAILLFVILSVCLSAHLKQSGIVSKWLNILSKIFTVGNHIVLVTRMLYEFLTGHPWPGALKRKRSIEIWRIIELHVLATLDGRWVLLITGDSSILFAAQLAEGQWSPYFTTVSTVWIIHWLRLSLRACSRLLYAYDSHTSLQLHKRCIKIFCCRKLIVELTAALDS